MNSIKGINSTQLKIIALLTMLIDHIGLMLFPNLIIFRCIGRLSFPIYCFALVEGFFYTKDVKKYVLRIAIFAVVAEIPYDLAISNSLINIYSQNVFFTLLIGLLMIFFMEKRPDLTGIIVIVAVFMAIILHTDYDAGGIAFIYFFYEFRDKKKYRNWCVIGLNIIVALLNPPGPLKFVQAFGSLALIPISFYNGEKGKGMKYLFYLFYPLHFLVLFFIRLFLIEQLILGWI